MEPPRQLGRLVPGRSFWPALSKEDRKTVESERLRWLYVRTKSKRRQAWAALMRKENLQTLAMAYKGLKIC